MKYIEDVKPVILVILKNSQQASENYESFKELGPKTRVRNRCRIGCKGTQKVSFP